MHPRIYCPLGFETLKDLEFRNREEEFKRETTSALNRRSRGGSRCFCPSGMHPEGPHRPCSERACRGLARDGSREVAARRAGVLSVAWNYRGILPDKKKPRETPPALGSPPDGKSSTSYHRPCGSSNARKSIWTQAKPPASSMTYGKAA